MMPSSMAAITVPGRLPMPPSTQMAKMRPMYSRPTDGSTGWMMIRKAPASAAVAIEMPKAMRLMRIGIDRQQPQRLLVLRHGHDGAADEGARQEQLQRGDEQERDDARHQHAQREIDEADAPGGADVGGVHVAVVDAEHQDQHHLGDEQQAEEEGEAAQRLLAALLEREVEHLVDRLPQQVERRQHEDGGEDRVEAERGVDDVGDVGADDDEGRDARC